MSVWALCDTIRIQCEYKQPVRGPFPVHHSYANTIPQVGRTIELRRYLEQQQTEKIENKVRDVGRIRITNVYTCCPGWLSGGVIRALKSNINIYYSPQLATPHL